jgi:hypothetical protein
LLILFLIFFLILLLLLLFLLLFFQILDQFLYEIAVVFRVDALRFELESLLVMINRAAPFLDLRVLFLFA